MITSVQTAAARRLHSQALGRRVATKASKSRTARDSAARQTNQEQRPAISRAPARIKQHAGSAGAAALARSDRALVDRCLAGDSSAWTQLYEQFHSSLLLSIRVLLGASGAQRDLVDEIGAKVWFAVVDRDGQRLGHFDGERGCRLSTFLAGLARNEIARYFRAERQRNLRETQFCRNSEKVMSDCQWHSETGMSTAVTEFLATLTPRERDYCQEHLLGAGRPSPIDYSDANRWQLNHRVRLKLWAFLDNL
ncbi:MAG TPA: hypothetical protein VGN12_06725 [Pirellulales bacterium]|jgi:DNA-directed RNA polymerase specialized sigma24 family protein